MHPVVNDMARVATKDDILPLAKPIVGVSGKVYNEIPVPAGTTTVVSIIGYNLYVHPLKPDPCENRRAEASFIVRQEQGHMGTRCIRVSTGKMARHGPKA